MPKAKEKTRGSWKDKCLKKARDWKPVSRRRTARMLKRINNTLSVLKQSVNTEVQVLTNINNIRTRRSTEGLDEVPERIKKLHEQENELLECRREISEALKNEFNSDIESDGSDVVVVKQHLVLPRKATVSDVMRIPSTSSTASILETESNLTLRNALQEEVDLLNRADVSTESVTPDLENEQMFDPYRTDIAHIKARIRDNDLPSSGEEADFVGANNESRDEFADDEFVYLAIQGVVSDEERLFDSNIDGLNGANSQEDFNLLPLDANGDVLTGDELIEAFVDINLDPDIDEFAIGMPEEAVNVDVQSSSSQRGRLNNEYFKEMARKEMRCETQDDKNRLFFELFDAVSVDGYMTKRATKNMFNLFRAFMENRHMTCYETCKKRYCLESPPITMCFEFQNIETGEITKITSETFPRKHFPRDKWIKVSEYATVDIMDVWNYAKECHCDQHNYVQSRQLVLFMDGLPMSKSGDAQLNAICVRIPPCRSGYVLGMHIYRKESGLTPNAIMHSILRDFRYYKFRLRQMIGDAPIRSKLRGLKLHSGSFSCEFCFAKGFRVDRRQVFPAVTFDEEKRTSFWYYDTATQIEQRGIGDFTADELKGMTGATPLSLTHEFEQMKQFLLEPMHNFSGCIKQFIRLMLKLPKTKQLHFTARQQKILKKFDKRWQDIILPREFNRRSRSLSGCFVFFKSQELISLAVAAPFAFAESFDDELDQPARACWLTFAMILRSVCMDDHGLWLNDVTNHLEMFSKKAYQMFEDTFGLVNCGWNIHNFFSHAYFVRLISRYPALSALGFESDFNIFKKWMQANTPSMGKQIIEKVFMRNSMSHDCQNIVRFSPFEATRFCDNLCYTRNMEFYEIVEIQNSWYVCKKIKTRKFKSGDVPTIDWYVNGIMLYLGYADEEETCNVDKRDVTGKAIIDGRYIVSIPFDALFI